VFAVPRSTPIAFAGNRLPALKKGQRINPGLGRPLRREERAVRFQGRKRRKLLLRKTCSKAKCLFMTCITFASPSEHARALVIAVDAAVSSAGSRV
jgi:hypothetical protein